jgi:hypothetical protein
MLHKHTPLPRRLLSVCFTNTPLHEDSKEFPSLPFHDTKKIKTGETLFFM